jgi:hypothetical protein
MVEAMGLKKCCIEVNLNGITSLPNIMKIYIAVQKLLVGDIHTYRQTDRDTHTHTHTDIQTADLISLLSFLASRLKMYI